MSKYGTLAPALAERGGVDYLIKRYVDGEGLSEIAKDLGFSAMALSKHLRRPENIDAWKEAKSIRADQCIEEIQSIVDDEDLGIYIDAEGNERVDNGAVNRAKLRVENRRWMAKNLAPEKYGDDHGGININLNLNEMHLNALRSRGKVIDG